jgi:hypothetical protein
VPVRVARADALYIRRAMKDEVSPKRKWCALLMHDRAFFPANRRIFLQQFPAAISVSLKF